jgi:hypothetical protein
VSDAFNGETSMKRVRIIMALAVLMAIVAIVVVVLMVTAGRGGGSSTTLSVASDQNVDSGGISAVPPVAKKPLKPVVARRPRKPLPQPLPEDSADLPESAVSADSASSDSAAAASSAEEAARSDDAAAERKADNQVEAFVSSLRLTDVQRQLGKDAIDQARRAERAVMAHLIYDGATVQKVRDLPNQGFTDDQIVSAIRPDVEASADIEVTLNETLVAALRQLRPILNPEDPGQLQTLNNLTSMLNNGGREQYINEETSDKRLKSVVQVVK